MEITRIGSKPSVQGPAEWFSGTVRMDSPFKGTGDSRIAGALVSFEPGARTIWHTHPFGQTIIVTAGVGWVGRDGGSVEEVRPGDIVYFEPGEKHWHGATATNAMSHIAVLESSEGKNTDWLEPVSDDRYRM
jgi:quercetin dioxygenase-like cupin family protein